MKNPKWLIDNKFPNRNILAQMIDNLLVAHMVAIIEVPGVKYAYSLTHNCGLPLMDHCSLLIAHCIFGRGVLFCDLVRRIQ